MRKFIPTFKDDKDRMLVLAMFITTIFFVFIPSLIVIFVPKNYISENSYEIAKSLFNFELLLFLISLLFFIPIIGWIAGFFLIPVITILNIVIVIINLCAIAGNKELSVPEPYKFI